MKKILGDEYWDKKTEVMVEIAKSAGWNDLDKEYWMKQTCATMSMILDLYKLMVETMGRKVVAVEEKIKEMERR